MVSERGMNLFTKLISYEYENGMEMIKILLWQVPTGNKAIWLE